MYNIKLCSIIKDKCIHAFFHCNIIIHACLYFIFNIYLNEKMHVYKSINCVHLQFFR